MFAAIIAPKINLMPVGRLSANDTEQKYIAV